jgi:hypothetical protein
MEQQEKKPWHRDVNGVWIPTAFAGIIIGMFVELGRLLETIHELQLGQSHMSITFTSEHDVINRRIGDVERTIEDLKTMQAVDMEHTHTQDTRIENLEKRK